jgi:sulfonate transport system ATP-binding protein
MREDEMSAQIEQGTRVVVQSVSKVFGEKAVLRHLNLTLEPGSFTAVVGKSGSGKSTLLRLIAGLDQPTQGKVTVEGGDTRVMFQDARLLPWKRVLHNVGLGLSGDWQGQAVHALLNVGLADRAGEYPSILSGGEKQRVALARALIHQPKLLLLDEPLGALDALTRIEMQALIERLWLTQRFTALLITHDVEEAVVLADRVVLIEEGHIALDVVVDLPRPRQRGDAHLAELKARILNRVMGVA